MVTFKPRASKIVPKEAAAMPLPNEETTPPVMKIYRVIKELPDRIILKNISDESYHISCVETDIKATKF